MNHDDIPVGPRRGQGREGQPDQARLAAFHHRDRPLLPPEPEHQPAPPRVANVEAAQQGDLLNFAGAGVPHDPPMDPHVGHLDDPPVVPPIPVVPPVAPMVPPVAPVVPPMQPAPNAVPAFDPAVNQMFINMLAGMLGQLIPPQPPPVDPPVPDPNLAADMAYIDQINNAFEDIDIHGPVHRPLIPPRALAGQHGPVAGADTTRDLQRRNIELADLVTRQAVLANNMVYRIGHPMPADTVQRLRQQAAETTQIALDLRQEARRQYVQLHQAERIHDRYNAVPIMPSYDNIFEPARVIAAKDLQAACKVFNPDDPKSPDFGIVWNNLRYFGQDNNFQEINYRQALSVLLMGDAKDLYHQHRDLNAPFEQTLTALYQAYAKPRSIQDDKQAILSIVRQPGESIAQCVARGEIQIDKQQLIHPIHKWPVLRETLVHEMVVNIILPKTQSHLTYLENESIETTGQTCNIYRLITELDKYELKHNLRPTVPMKPTFHSAHTGRFDPQVRKSHNMDPKANLTEKFFSTNAAEIHKQTQTGQRSRKPKPNGDKPNKPQISDSANPKSNCNNDNQIKSNSKPKNNSKPVIGNKPRYDNKNPNSDKPKSKKPYSNKPKPNHKTTSKPRNRQQEDPIPLYEQPLVKTGELRGKPAEMSEEGSFYAKFGNKPCICTPMSKLKKSEN